jgi:hypothetical protein
MTSLYSAEHHDKLICYFIVVGTGNNITSREYVVRTASVLQGINSTHYFYCFSELRNTGRYSICVAGHLGQALGASVIH